MLITGPDGTSVSDGTVGPPAPLLYLDGMASPAGPLHPGVTYTLAVYTFGIPWALSTPVTVQFSLPVPPAPLPPLPPPASPPPLPSSP